MGLNTVFGARGCSINYGNVVVTQCRNSFMLTAELFIANGTVNDQIIRTVLRTSCINYVLSYSVAGSMTSRNSDRDAAGFYTANGTELSMEVMN